MGSEVDVWWCGKIGIGGWMRDARLGVRCVKPLYVYWSVMQVHSRPVGFHVCRTRCSMRYLAKDMSIGLALYKDFLIGSNGRIDRLVTFLSNYIPLIFVPRDCY